MYHNHSKQIEGKVTILWNKQMSNNRTIFNYKSDIIIHDNVKGTRQLIML